MKKRKIMHAGWLVLLLSHWTMEMACAETSWPQWRGAHRDGISSEVGITETWPEAGPERLWLYKNAGKGYSGPAVVNGQYVTMGTRNNSTTLLCLDAATGEESWSTSLGDILGNSWGDGPRGTPAVEAERVYALTGEGVLVCTSISDGSIRWKVSMSDLGGSQPNWGYTESVLIDGSQIVVTPGGGDGTVAALDKMSGKLLWQSADITDKAHYSSIVPASIHGKMQYIQRTEKSIFGLHPKTGALLWKTDFPGRTAVIPTPVVYGNQVYVTAGYGAGCKAIEILANNEVKELYANRNMKNHHGGVVRMGTHLFGYSDGVGWMCQNLIDGSEVWSERKALGKGAVTMVDGKLICLDENKGSVTLLEASTEGFRQRSQFTPAPQSEIRASRGKVWTHPVVAEGRLYLRDQDLIYCYTLK
ncbi:MAG: PQQ-like beta-propeller repeat protein [Verrucomicrobiota bacterium]|nr:PQQ-like beta-propeller repeat protein [Verrucomicrobiota bacterium]